MAAPTVNSVGAVFGTPGGAATTAAYSAPATIGVDDILVLISLTNSTTTLSGLPSGWAHVTGSPNSSTGGTNATLNICWKRAVAGDVGAVSYTFTLSASDYAEGAIVAVRGAINSGSPWDTGAGAPAFAHTGANTGTAPAVSLTTQGADRLLINGALNQTGSAGWTASSGFTKDFEKASGGAFGTCTGYHVAQAVAGATGNVQPVCPVSGQMVNFLGALLPAGGGATNNGTTPLTVGAVRPPRTGSTLVLSSSAPSTDHQPPAAFIGTPTRRPWPAGSALILGSRAPSPDFQQPPDVITAGRYPVNAGSAVVLSSRADPVIPTDSQPRPLVAAPLRPGLPGSALTVSSTAASTDVQPSPLVIVAGMRPPRAGRAVVARMLASPPAPPTLAPVAVGSFTIPRQGPAGVALLTRMVSDLITCITPRPFTGVTVRPGSGTTAYSTAMTARPSTGTTARPNTGTTDNPC